MRTEVAAGGFRGSPATQNLRLASAAPTRGVWPGTVFANSAISSNPARTEVAARPSPWGATPQGLSPRLTSTQPATPRVNQPLNRREAATWYPGSRQPMPAVPGDPFGRTPTYSRYSAPAAARGLPEPYRSEVQRAQPTPNYSTPAPRYNSTYSPAPTPGRGAESLRALSTPSPYTSYSPSRAEYSQEPSRAYAAPTRSYTAPTSSEPDRSFSYRAPSYAAPTRSYSTPSYSAPARSFSMPSYSAPVRSYSAPSFGGASIGGARSAATFSAPSSASRSGGRNY